MNIDEIKDKRIAVLLSGGVDSSVVVYELVRMGVQPDCFYIKIGPEEQEEWDCTSEEDLEMATHVAAKYGCKLQVVDCHKEYWNEVTRYTMEKVKAGYTPNPDVMCNRLIKFGAFHEKMGVTSFLRNAVNTLNLPKRLSVCRLQWFQTVLPETILFTDN